MAKRRGGSLPRVMPTGRLSGLDIRMAMPGLPIVAPDPLAVSLGGSETAGLQLAAEFVRQGHRVTMFANVETPFTWKGVRLAGEMSAEVAGRPCDLFLVQRMPEILRSRGGARAAFLWLHDQAPQSLGCLAQARALAKRFVFVSDWQLRQYAQHLPGLTAGQGMVAPNGVDLDLIAEATAGVERDPFRIVYTARPERGLEALLEVILPRLLKDEPRTRLHLAGYADENSVHGPYVAHLRAMAASYGDAVIWHEPLGKRDLYRLMASGGLYLYPTPAPAAPRFAETSCITTMEAMACGLPWISTDAGAIPETVGDAGDLVPLAGAPHAGAPEVMDRLADEALRAMRDPARAGRLRQAGLQRAQGLGWERSAKLIADAALEVIDTRRGTRSPGPRPTPRPAPSAQRPAPSVAILTPSYDGRFIEPYVQSLMRIMDELRARGIATGWIPRIGCALLPQVRNALAANFLVSEATHALWVDSDISWSPLDVVRLLEHDVDFVAATYRAKNLSGRFLHGARQGARLDPQAGLIKVEFIGAGFMLSKRTVFERIAAAYPEGRLDGRALSFGLSVAAQGQFHDYFPTRCPAGEYVGEDVGFYRLWRSISGQVWLDPSIRLTHYGMHGFTGDPMTAFVPASQVGEAA